ncbi:hypothetical protein BKA70DRAFT_1563361 [Coprinopsis sp. MPI-PUGE-AT-0042]|nr:hypothetical protein BKA70DRAFT_1563361 [Coprinopsis sp. MPI-PUGE-AT-0042]
MSYSSSMHRGGVREPTATGATAPRRREASTRSRRVRSTSQDTAYITNGSRQRREGEVIPQNARVRRHRHIMEYTIPDSDLDSPDEEPNHHEPRREEESPEEKAKKRVRLSEGESLRTEAAKAIGMEPDVNYLDSGENHRGESSSNVALNFARTDSTPLGVITLDKLHGWATTLKIFLLGFTFGFSIAGAVFIAWVVGLRWGVDRPALTI